MTPTLKAMVEAMGREFLRQTEESDEAPVCQFTTPALRVTDVYGGNFDLEKVARAGLRGLCHMHTTPITVGEDVFSILRDQP